MCALVTALGATPPLVRILAPAKRRQRAEVTVTNVLAEVCAFVSRLSPQAVCDDCIAERLGLTVRQHTKHKTRELAGTQGFERQRGECSLCGASKLLISRA
jgi:hypothetical protein